MKKWFISAICSLTLVTFVHTSQSAAAFTDLTEDSYYGTHVYDLVERGQISGYPDGTFRTFQPVKRAEATQMLAKFSGRYYPIDEAFARYEGENYFPFDFYSDVAMNAWYANAVYSLLNDGVVGGYPDGKFYPESYMTRGEVAKVLYELLGLRVSAESDYFEDLAGHFAQHEIETLALHGLFLGKGDGKFGPNDLLTRGDLAVLLYRLNAQQDLLFAGQQVDVKKTYVSYDDEWLQQQDKLDWKQPTYIVEGADLEQFLSDVHLQAAIDIQPDKNYVVTHFQDAMCAPIVTQAAFSDGTLTTSEMYYGHQLKLETGEELVCAAMVEYALELYEVPATLDITTFIKIPYPYRFVTELPSEPVIPYKAQ